MNAHVLPYTPWAHTPDFDELTDARRDMAALNRAATAEPPVVLPIRPGERDNTNKILVYRYIRDWPGCTRKEIGEALAIAITTVGTSIERLRDANLVVSDNVWRNTRYYTVAHGLPEQAA